LDTTLRELERLLLLEREPVAGVAVGWAGAADVDVMAA
jgi:hypothetical protein